MNLTRNSYHWAIHPLRMFNTTLEEKRFQWLFMCYAGAIRTTLRAYLFIKRIIIHWLITSQLHGTWIFQSLYKLIIYLHGNEAIGFAFVLIHRHIRQRRRISRKISTDVMCSQAHTHTMQRNRSESTRNECFVVVVVVSVPIYIYVCVLA